MRSLSMSNFDKLTKFAKEFTGGAFNYQGTGGDLGYGARYIDGNRQLVWLGSQGGRWCAFSYYAGAVTHWARLYGKAIPLEIVTLIHETLPAVPKRWSKRADAAFWEGRGDAESRWERRYLLKLTNSQGIEFNVIWRGPRCGRNTYDAPMVEIFDTRYDHTDYGQFVTTYFVGTMLGDFGAYEGNQGVWPRGLDLHGGVDSWKLSADNMTSMVKWLRELDN